MTFFEPIRFGKYLILDRIAVGGMAELFRAKITSVEGFEKLVAIKKILPQLTEDENLINMFIDEAKLAAMLSHQNIVQIYDLGSMEDAYYMAMEYIYGKNLRVILNKVKEAGLSFPVEYALYITCRICAGLDYAHNFKDLQGQPLKIIHRDVSPPNILVTYEGEVKIVDFGIVKAARRSSDTKVGVIKGKAAYMSPEQASGKRIDHRSDIFATGILLYEMVTGKRMFEGPDTEVLERAQKADFEAPEMLVADLPPKLYEIQHRALAKDPELRYQSCSELLKDLEKCLSESPIRPSAELLAHYMKRLFATEIAAEVSALQKAGAQIPHVYQEEAIEGRTKTLRMTKDPSPLDAPEAISASGRQRLWLGASAVAFVVIAVVFALLFQKKSVSTPDTQHPAVTMPSSEVTESTGPAPPPVSGSAEKDTTTNKTTMREPVELERALQSLQNGQFAQAVALFEELLSQRPAARSEVAIPYAQALQGQAVTLLETDPQQAETLLAKAVEVDPKNARAHFYLGKIHTARQDYSTAMAAYGEAIELDPSFPDAFFNLGYVYTVTRDYPRAEEMFDKTIALAPSYLDEVYFNLGVVQNLQGKSSESVRNLERALEFNPDNAKAREYLLRFKGASRNLDETHQPAKTSLSPDIS